MTASDTRPDGIPLPGRSGIRPRDRRIVEAIALVCAVSALLVLQWKDEDGNVRKNLKPPEKVTTVAEGQIGELVGAQWKIYGRATGEPLGAKPQGDVTELRLKLAVRPSDAASAKAVGSYGLGFRLHDGDGHEWSATALKTGEPRAGVAMGFTVRGTVPRAKADELELEIQAPKTARKPGGAQPSLRFSH
ncbi:hypothetical protein E1293_20610 [Actinomadura darangshiensis]|uniref:DUF4352 domain-containing protein n=1 Tax=Actinomadura darangshiensis TaxID=705336 RepID=A0A4V2YV81_9ACTN|nr:hypothetical protein [Actinomadura darangshiensis]TDD80517.1 hypothetical protein E1293_20610 [Actinomadura darangshiensis]